METREPPHGAGTSEDEIDQMEKGKLTGCDVVFTVEFEKEEEEMDQMERVETGVRDVVVPEEVRSSNGVFATARRALIGAGARAAFYPTVLRNAAPCRTKPNRRWWGRVDKEEEEEIDHMERVETRVHDVVVAEEARGSNWVFAAAHHALIDAGARAAFYPTVLCNVALCRIMPNRRWWDRVDKYVWLGAVPSPSDVPVLERLGVKAVVTLTKYYETLVSSSTYEASRIAHLEIPTTDFAFAPSMMNIHSAVDFIHRHASQGDSTYVHCKAGKARSTTVVLCYLVKYRNMTPQSALDHVKSRRPQVQLADAQWKAVKDYFSSLINNQTYEHSDSEFISVTDADLDGYQDGDS